MSKLFSIVRSIASKFVDWIVVPLFILVLAIVLLAVPMELAIQSWDLLQMQSTAMGQITRSEVINHGDMPRSVVEYTFSANNKNYTGNRVSPQYFLTNLPSSNRDAESNLFEPDQQAAVYFDSSNPQRCSLVYGYNSGFVAVIFLFCGMLVGATKGYLRFAFGGLIVYSTGLLLFGPRFIRYEELHYHLIALVVGALAFWVFVDLGGRRFLADPKTN